MIFIIAEAGVNHGGSVEIAERLIDHAKAAGANAVKFQLFKDRPEIERLRMTENQIFDLSDFAKRAGIEFACTPFYVEAVAFLDPLVKRHKIASGWMKNPEIFDAALATGKPVIASMGMAEIGVHAYRNKPNASFLHCISLYPCPDEKANLSKINTWWIPGYSDPAVGTLACVAAAAMGAKIIEKHLTLDKTTAGPDHSCSAEPAEFAAMVRDIRRVETML